MGTFGESGFAKTFEGAVLLTCFAAACACFAAAGLAAAADFTTDFGTGFDTGPFFAADFATAADFETLPGGAFCGFFLLILASS